MSVQDQEYGGAPAYATPALLNSNGDPSYSPFAYVESLGRLFRFTPADVSTIDNVLVIGSAGGKGQWLATTAAGAPVASIAALQAIPASERFGGMLVTVLAGTSGDAETYRFHATSTAADASQNLVVTPSAGSGRWLRNDKQVFMSLPVGFATADAALLFTVPVGCRLALHDLWWDPTVSWTGGSSSSIGVHSSRSGLTAKGALLGGSGGDVAATLVSSATGEVGTIGSALATVAAKRVIFEAADTLNFDQITSVFTAGAANVRVAVSVIKNVGA
jgi:hypothetical protein